MTYIPTREGWLYLGVMDLFSRQVVGWAMSVYRDEALVTDALDVQSQRVMGRIMNESVRL